MTTTESAPAATGEVVLDDAPLRVDELVAVARGARLELGPTAERRITDSRAVVDRFVDGPELIYGLNTGLGHLRDTRVPRDVLKAYQAAIVASHDGGFGPPLRADIVRAAMAARVAGISRGGAGASPAIASTLVAMLNAGIHPIVPTVGSVGASDLMHMAAIGLVVVGEGRAELDGEVVPGGEALRRAGIPPAQLEPKDGLALVSANGVSIGHAALVVARARRAARLADLVVAVALEAARGNLSIVDPVVARAKPVPGQSESAALIMALLAGSDRCAPGSATSIQDPLSFRVAPQVHGAFRDATEQLARHVEIELAAIDDNPLVDLDGGRLVSNGNFHPLAMALAADAMRPAIAHVGQISDRRLNHAWAALAGVFDFSSVEGLNRIADLGGALLRYASATRYTELRQLAAPVTLDVAPLDLAVEDHATNAPLAVRRTDEALDLLDELMAVELLTCADVISFDDGSSARVGVGVAAALGALAEVRSRLPTRPPAADVHAAMTAALYDRLLPAAEDAIAG